ncbi:MAG: MATE family efflux transporter [Clostridia bacterium]|nr:MATE family efflux transporter [Clostridia bacterium]
MKARYVGDRAFYRMALTVAVPIMAQNFITNFVSLLDNLMVGALGTEQMSATSISNQILLIFNLAIFGAMSGAGIFTAQYYGKGDNDGIRLTVRFKAVIGLSISALGLLVFSVFGGRLISLFLHESDAGGDLELTLTLARQYMNVMLFGLLPFALTQILASTVRETGDTFSPMLAGLGAVGVNCLFNYLLIFGKLFFPAMGVRGAAVATVMSRFFELSAMVLYSAVKRKRLPFFKGAFTSLRIPKAQFAGFSKKTLPLLFNEVLWSGGMSALSVAFSLNGLTVVAAYSISSTISQLFNVFTFSMGVGIGIISARLLGSGKHEEAVDTVRKLIAFSLSIGVAFSVLLFFFGGQITRLYNTDPESKTLAVYFIRVFALTLPLATMASAQYFTLRSGGKTFITFLFDSGTLWCVTVPLAFILFYAFRLEIHVLFPIVQCAELVKVVVGCIMLKSRVWVRTIV